MASTGHRVVGKPPGIRAQPPAGRRLNVAINVHGAFALHSGERGRANARNSALDSRAGGSDERCAIALVAIAGSIVGKMPGSADVRHGKRVGRNHPRISTAAIGGILNNLTQIGE